jgi:hypothetical protein
MAEKLDFGKFPLPLNVSGEAKNSDQMGRNP